MDFITHSLAFVFGGVAVALVIRANPERSLRWLNKVVAKAKAKAASIKN